MSFPARFRQGMKAAIPIWIAFVPSSIAWGIAAQAHGLTLTEITLLSAWVYSGPAQFAVLAPLAEGKSALQVLVAGSLMNVRFLPMSTALAPFFRGVKRLPLLISSHVISASSFIVPYLQFQREREAASGKPNDASYVDGYANLAFFLGVGATAFTVWVLGTVSGFLVAFGVPPGFEEALRFILPGYFAGLLVAEMKGWTMPLICLFSLIAAVPGALASTAWGWIITATAIAAAGWIIDEWKSRASKLF
ncbi:MAG TPA: AzlC family ABC transporter permease [Candidatus Binatia bacterium]|nr:AzlC family ABC transporter permease [Candidatus Binatia bacterium]